MSLITIDARMWKDSGIGTYLSHLAPEVIRANPRWTFCLLGDVDSLSKSCEMRNVVLRELRAPIYSVREQFELMRTIPKDSALFWAPHFNIPRLIPSRIKLLVTVHDVFHLAMPNGRAAFHRGFYARSMFKAVRRNADAIIAVSQFTKSEFCRLVGPAPNIRVIHSGVDPSFFSIPKTPRFREKPFFLYVGNVKPHKNLSALIQAFITVNKNMPHDLVIVGKREGFITGDSRVLDEARAAGDRVVFTGHVEDDDLRRYYAQAEGFVFPSTYEGFGFPPLEAMAAGCPVACSNEASLPEVCGDAALFFDPFSFTDISEKILRLALDPTLRNSLQEKGFARAQGFKWQTSIDATNRLLRELV